MATARAALGRGGPTEAGARCPPPAQAWRKRSVPQALQKCSRPPHSTLVPRWGSSPGRGKAGGLRSVDYEKALQGA